MATRIYGRSDDLVEFDGDVHGEMGCFGTDEENHPGVMVVCSDGTVLVVKYGKGGLGIWGVTVTRQGELFERIEPCEDEDAAVYSDVAHFKDGLKWAMAAKTWERVK